MAEFVYVDASGHEARMNLRMLYSTAVLCGICGETMWRKPQRTAVNWNGLKPSQGTLTPAIREMIDGAPERRDKYLEYHKD